MRAKRIIMVLVAMLAALGGGLTVTRLGAQASAPEPRIVQPEVNWERPGGDYGVVDVGDDPAGCQALCARDERCAAFSYVARTAQGAGPRCYLKRIVPPRVYNPCCVSGVKFDANAGFDVDDGTDRPGGDVQSWKVGSAIECRNICQQSGAWCVAFAHDKGAGMCYLKNRYGGRQRAPGWASGVVRPYASRYAY